MTYCLACQIANAWGDAIIRVCCNMVCNIVHPNVYATAHANSEVSMPTIYIHNITSQNDAILMPGLYFDILQIQL